MSAYLASRYTKADVEARQYRLLHLNHLKGASLGPDGLVQDTLLFRSESSSSQHNHGKPADITPH